MVHELRALPAATALGRRVATSALWMQVVKWVTPTVFVLIYLALPGRSSSADSQCRGPSAVEARPGTLSVDARWRA